MEDLAIKCDIDTNVEVFPCPVVAYVILGEALPLDQFTCKYENT